MWPFPITSDGSFSLAWCKEGGWAENNGFTRTARLEPPAMVIVALNDSVFKTARRIYSNLVVGRKSEWVYKGRLRARDDSAPLTHTPFASGPTVHRCGVGIMCMLAVIYSLHLRSVGVSQEFQQSDNLAEADRCTAIPPGMVKLQHAGFFHSPEANLKTLYPPSRGFFISNLCMGRDTLLCVCS